MKRISASLTKDLLRILHSRPGELEKFMEDTENRLICKFSDLVARGKLTTIETILYLDIFRIGKEEILKADSQGGE